MGALDDLGRQYGLEPEAPAVQPVSQAAQPQAAGLGALDRLAEQYGVLTPPGLPESPTSGVTVAPKGQAPYEGDPEKMSIAEDMARSGATGVARGAMGLAGLVGDVQKATDVDEHLVIPSLPRLPTSQDITGAAKSIFGDFEHTPETVAGEYAQTVGEFAPAAAFPGSAAMRAANVAVPALASETAGQLAEGTGYEPHARIAGAVAGGFAPSVAARAATPLPIPAERQAALRTLQSEGVRPTAGQASGSKTLRFAESELGGGKTARIVEQQNDDFTRAVLRRVGEDANRATPEVMDRAFKRIGGEFDRVAAGNQVNLDAKLSQDLAAVVDNYINLVGPASRAPVVEKTARDIAQKLSQGPLYGKNYQSLTSRLARQARGTKDPELQDALYGLREALDDAFERTLQAAGNTADLQALKEARRQYKNLITVERAAVGGGEEAAMGAISPARLRMADAGQNRRGYVRGNSEFSELARSGQAIMSPMPQSGTAPRAFMRGAPALLGGVAGGGTGGGAGAVAGAVLGPAIAGRTLMSRPVQSYLRNQLVPSGPGNALARSGVNALLARP